MIGAREKRGLGILWKNGKGLKVGNFGNIQKIPGNLSRGKKKSWIFIGKGMWGMLKMGFLGREMAEKVEFFWGMRSSGMSQGGEPK